MKLREWIEEGYAMLEDFERKALYGPWVMRWWYRRKCKEIRAELDESRRTAYRR